MPANMSTVTSKGQVTIPKIVRDALGIMEKDKLLFIVEGDRATLIPLLQRPITELFGARPANRSYPGHHAIRDAIHAELGERVARGEE